MRQTTRRSDGSWEETRTTHPFWRGVAWAFGGLFVIVMAVQTWWLGIVILALVIASIVARKK